MAHQSRRRMPSNDEQIGAPGLGGVGNAGCYRTALNEDRRRQVELINKRFHARLGFMSHGRYELAIQVVGGRSSLGARNDVNSREFG